MHAYLDQLSLVRAEYLTVGETLYSWGALLAAKLAFRILPLGCLLALREGSIDLDLCRRIGAPQTDAFCASCDIPHPQQL